MRLLRKKDKKKQQEKPKDKKKQQEQEGSIVEDRLCEKFIDPKTNKVTYRCPSQHKHEEIEQAAINSIISEESSVLTYDRIQQQIQDSKDPNDIQKKRYAVLNREPEPKYHHKSELSHHHESDFKQHHEHELKQHHEHELKQHHENELKQHHPTDLKQRHDTEHKHHHETDPCNTHESVPGKKRKSRRLSFFRKKSNQHGDSHHKTNVDTNLGHRGAHHPHHPHHPRNPHHPHQPYNRPRPYVTPTPSPMPPLPSRNRPEPPKGAKRTKKPPENPRSSGIELVKNRDPNSRRMWEIRGTDGKPIFGRKEREAVFGTKIRLSLIKRLGFDPYRIYKFGERGSGIRHEGSLQDFYDLRDECLANGTLFEDPQFPANDSSLYFSHRPNYRVEWLRPGQICKNPQLFVEGFSRFDVQQGELGDCWLLAAVANLTMYHRLFFQVVPDDQAFYDKYAGIFHFRFWQYGRWIDIVIDDRLPTRHGQLLYLRSSTENEFWSALLEKAYAKLHGSYEALKGGSTCEAMEDFTGGVTEMYELNAAPADLYKIMLKAFERGSLMGCSIEPDPNELEARTQDGLVKGHAYSITKVKFVPIHTPNTSGKIPLLRLRNPWGDDTEWNGAWSDSSPEWRYIPNEEKESLGLNFDSDGEFWMSYKDFVNKFDRIELCNLNPDSLDQNNDVKKWEVSYYEGSWIRGVTAGGCRNFIDTFASNPQYRITLTETDDEEDDGKCTVIVALMQKNRRSKRRMGLEELSIGFVLYYIRDVATAPKPLDRNFFKHNAIIARCPSYINLREITCRFRLYPGTYCIIPSTFDPNEEGEFLLRVFSEHKNNMEENDATVGMVQRKVKKRHARKKEDGPDGSLLFEHFDMAQNFHQLAGESEEINWRQLQKLLKLALRKNANNGLVQTQAPQAEASFVPGQSQVPDTGAENIINMILQLLCTTICKDTQLANDFAPQTEETPLMQNPPEPVTDSHVGFGNDVCRSMIAMYDDDCSGKMGMLEFKELWTDIIQWISTFEEFDHDHSNNISGFELRSALANAGYSVNNHTLNLLMLRYGNDGYLELDNFVMSLVKLKHLMQLFETRDPEKTGSVDFTIDEWLNTTIYL